MKGFESLAEKDCYIESFENSLEIGVYVTDLETFEVLYMNPKLRSFYGTPENVAELGMKCYEVFSPGRTETCPVCRCKELRETPDMPLTMEAYNPKYNLFVQVTSHLIQWTDGRDAVFHNVQDITEHKLVEMFLEKKVNQQAAISEISRIFTVLSQENDMFRAALEKMVASLELNAAYIMKADYALCHFTLFESATKKGHAATLRKHETLPLDENSPVLKGLLRGIPWIVDDFNRVSNEHAQVFSRSQSVTFIALPILYNGKIWSLLCCTSGIHNYRWSEDDITFLRMVSNIFSTGVERIQREKLLAEAQERLDIALTISSSGVWEYVNETQQFTFDDRLARILELEKPSPLTAQEAVAHLNMKDPVKKGADDFYFYLDSTATDAVIAKDMHYIRKDGSDLYLKNDTKTIYGAGGMPIRTIGLITDITRSVLAEKQLTERMARLKEAAEQVNAAKSDYLSNMSHEIRTPLNAVIGMATLTQREALPLRAQKYLQQIESSSRQLLGTINDILDISRIESDKMALAKEPFHLDSFIAQVRENVKKQLKKRERTLVVRVGDQVPQNLVGDHLRLAQVMTSILESAMKLSKPGAALVLAINLERNQFRTAILRFDITDSGLDQSEDEVYKLFNPFESDQRNKLRQEGSIGLGLAVPQRIIGLMGGMLTFSNTKDGGVFSFSLEMQKGEAQPAAEQRHESLGESLPDFSGKRILLVEDIPINSEILLAFLEPTRAQVDLAENGLEAVEILQERGGIYDLVLMDVQMPVMDGFSATKVIRKTDTAIPIIAMAANVFREDVEEIAIVGMNGYIPKPIDEKVLFKTLSRYLLQEE